jgi:hypothetical protein
MVSPHFPPDSSAGTHRVRLLAPHLERAGWRPTVVTLTPDPRDGRLDPRLAAMVAPSLDVVRCRPWSARWTRPLGFGDLGLRGFSALRRTCIDLLARDRHDAVFITIYPTYPALLGPMLKRRFRVRFVLDYQDPWVGAWGREVGPSANGAPDLRSRASRQLAQILEPIAVKAADAITAVSAGTYEEVLARTPATPVCAAIPLGWEEADFARDRTANPFFDPADGRVHLCYVGTLLPAGFGTLAALLRAAALLRDREPALYARLTLWFIGTSNQARDDAAPRVRPMAHEHGVADVVREIPARIAYLDALAVLRQASGILLLGSRERHYTASKLYPALLAARPMLAIFHEASSVVEILRRAAPPPAARIVTYGDGDPDVAPSAESVYAALHAALTQPACDRAAVDLSAVQDLSAQALAGKLAAVLDQISDR